MSDELEIIEIPPAPPELAGSGARRWREVWATGIEFRKVDALVIERYCTYIEQWFDFRDLLSREGYITVGSKGQEVPHPAVKLMNDVEAKAQQLEKQLGLSFESQLDLQSKAIGVRKEQTALGQMLDETETLPKGN